MEITNKNALKENIIPQKVRNNLSVLRESLISSEVVSISSVQGEQDNPKQGSFIQQYTPHIRSLLMNLENPYKCILIMPKLLNKSLSLTDPDPIFNGSLFNKSLQSPLTAYLHTQTSFMQLRESCNRIVDVFYKYLLYQENTLMEITLQGQTNQESSLGNWLKQEGINKMFSKYYDSPLTYTIFISNFMLYGVAYLFMSATKILKNDVRVIKRQDIAFQVLENIQIAYIRKYRLDYLMDYHQPLLF